MTLAMSAAYLDPIEKVNDPMHPYMHEQLIRAHSDDVDRRLTRVRDGLVPHRPGPRRSHRPGPRHPLRHQVGWLLVNVGLRLALDRHRTRRGTAWAGTGQHQC